MKKNPPKKIIPKDRKQLLDEEFKKEKIKADRTHVNDNQIKYCCDKIVQHIKQLQFKSCSISSVGVSYLSALKWKNLTVIELTSCGIGPRGCYYLSRMRCTALTQLYLSDNMICSSGAMHLCKAQWKNLKTLVLFLNFIGDGVQHFNKSNWVQLQHLQLNWNGIKIHMGMLLLLGAWKRLFEIGLSQQNYKVEVDEEVEMKMCDPYLFYNKYPKFRSFVDAGFIKHMHM